MRTRDAQYKVETTLEEDRRLNVRQTRLRCWQVSLHNARQFQTDLFESPRGLRQGSFALGQTLRGDRHGRM